MTSRPRLLVLTPDFPPATGGIQLLAHRVVKNLTCHQARVVTLRTPGSERFDADSEIDIRRVAGIGRWRPSAVAMLNAAAVAEAVRFRPDIVLSIHIVVSPAAAAIRHRLGVPFVQYLHAKELGTRRSLTSFAVRRADACIAVSRHTAAMAAEAGARPERIHRIPPGADVPHRTLAERSERPTVLTVARLEDRYKGHDMMVRAMPLVAARIPGVRWIVVGHGPLRDHLRRLAATTGLNGSVDFVGEVDDDERDAWFDRAHVFVMPSRLPRGGTGGEGFGIVYLEAGGHHLPVIAGNVGGALDAVIDGETGLLIDPTDSVALTDAICTVLGDSALAQRLGRGGAAHAREHAWEKITPRIEQLLCDLRDARR